MGSLLLRQLKKLGLSGESPPDAERWRAFLDRVERTYHEADQDRYTLERSLRTSSREMQELYDNLVRSEANFKVLVERAPDPVIVHDGSKIRYVNPATAKLLGYDRPDDLVGRAPLDIVHPEDVGTILDHREQAARGEQCPIQVRLMRCNGTPVVVVGQTAPITFNETSAWLTMARDISDDLRCDREREEAERALRLSEERYRLLFEASPLSIMLFDRQSLSIVGVNQAANKLYGYSREEFLALKLPDLKIPEDVPELVARMQAVQGAGASGQASSWRGTKRHRRKDGALLDLDITSHPVSLDGRALMLAIAVDVTEARRLEEQLRQSQKMEAVGRLAGGIAHDFNNILCVILADSDYLKDELGESHPLRGDVERVERAARKAAALTGQLLAFSRRQIMQPRSLVLNGVVIELEKMLRRLIGEDIAFDVKLNPALHFAMADQGQIAQVIMNLVVNARDAMPRGGRMLVETRNVEVRHGKTGQSGELPPGAYVSLTVKDSGCGMEQATVSRIFEPFFTTKEVGKGTGLGLSTVLGIVQQSRGFIDVESEPGRGSTFTVYLPRAERPATANAARPRPPREARSGQRVLLVEDDEGVRRVATTILRRAGYVVVEASGGEEALSFVQDPDAPVDLLLTDLVMPGMDGCRLASLVRERHPTLPIVYMSGYTEHDAIRKGELGVRARLIQKPFSGDDLAAAVDGALGDAA